VSDAGLANLKAVPGLASLALNNMRISDAGLIHLKVLPSLGWLDLEGTRVSDAGLEHIKNLRKLAGLRIESTRISARGLATLKKAFPQARFYWSEPNHSVAEAVLARGAALGVRVAGESADRQVRTADALPSAYFRITRACLSGVHEPLSPFISRLSELTDPEFDRLESLDLSGASIADIDFKRLEGLPYLTELSLAQTQMKDEDLARLQHLVHLRRLVLDNTPVIGIGLADLNRLPALTELRLGCSSLTYFQQLAELKCLERLSLCGSSITDADLSLLSGLSGLRDLDLTRTQVTATGVAELQKAMPNCRIRFGTASR
jgi:Leucine-rich repeat (LRR) protein